MKNSSKLSPKQSMAWRVMSIFTLPPMLYAISREYDLREPFTAGITLISWLAISFLCRRFVRDNTGADGRLSRKSAK